MLMYFCQHLYNTFSCKEKYVSLFRPTRVSSNFYQQEGDVGVSVIPESHRLGRVYIPLSSIIIKHERSNENV
jgi:hypothetical protein